MMIPCCFTLVGRVNCSGTLSRLGVCTRRRPSNNLEIAGRTVRRQWTTDTTKTPTKPTVKSGRTNPSTSDSTITISTQELAVLQQELQEFKHLVQKTQTQHYQVQSLARNLQAQTNDMEALLRDIGQHVQKISGLEQMAQRLTSFLKSNKAVQGVVHNFESVVERSVPWVVQYKYTLWAALLAAVGIWKTRQYWLYERTSEELGHLAQRTLEQESLRVSIQETLQTVANSPSTLTTLNDLVQQLISHERTQQDLVALLVFALNTPQVQTALLDLLAVVFANDDIQRMVGQLLLEGLNKEDTKRMLDEQTQSLVINTVQDPSVQQATARGIQQSLWYAATPSLLWNAQPETPKTKTQPSDQVSTKENPKLHPPIASDENWNTHPPQ